jgi:hypothetical protein
MLLLTANEQTDRDPQVGQLSGNSPQPFIDELRSLAMQFSGATGVPVSSLGIIQDNPSSAEAIQSGREDICLIAQRDIAADKATLRRVMHAAVAIETNMTTDKLDEGLRGIEAKFSDPILHTLFIELFMHIGKLFGSYEIGMVMLSIIQMILLSLIFSYCVEKTAVRGAGLLARILLTAFYALTPFCSILSVSMTKDVLFTGVFMLILSFIFEDPALPSTPLCWGSALFLAVFCTGVAFIVQAVAQQYTSASHVGVIFTLEPVFAGFVAFFLAGEILLPRGYLGAFLLLSSLLIMEIDVKEMLEKRKAKKAQKN